MKKFSTKELTIWSKIIQDLVATREPSCWLLAFALIKEKYLLFFLIYGTEKMNAAAGIPYTNPGNESWGGKNFWWILEKAHPEAFTEMKKMGVEDRRERKGREYGDWLQEYCQRIIKENNS